MPETLTLPPKCGIAPGSNVDTTANVLKASFGNNYSQRGKDGDRPLTDEASFTISPLTVAEWQAIDDFLRARGGAEAFYFKLPPRNTFQLVTCEKWGRQLLDGNILGMSMTFGEVFVP